jgi:hypothetical protein
MVFNAAVGPGECAGSATGSVVCQNFSHGYAAFSEPCAGPSPKRCGCLFAFISQQFGACQPGLPVAQLLDVNVDQVAASARARVRTR